ncbi:hypothetical protein HZA76_00575 [Candidatus Roizmanbacteria bacterium]|nr:hypothetical protein [Candidatus Roizmanbacteria bacterium]
MANSQVFDEKLKNKVKADLLQVIILGLESKNLTLAGMKASANYILDHIEKINNYSQFLVFMNLLKTKWKVFENVYKIYNHISDQDKEKEVINKLQSFIKSQN